MIIQSQLLPVVIFNAYTKKAETPSGISAFQKNWRQPTLAEAIQPLPSARLRLTAEFGMGSGRTTALWPPKIFKEHYVLPENYTQSVLDAFSVYRVENRISLGIRKKRSSLTTD
jgi:hypothetical protein